MVLLPKCRVKERGFRSGNAARGRAPTFAAKIPTGGSSGETGGSARPMMSNPVEGPLQTVERYRHRRRGI
jgi:hypothetical protein